MSSIALDVPLGGKYGPQTIALFERARKQHLPIAAGIELTHRCNLACVHCYVNLPAADRVAKKREMTTTQAKAVIDQIVDAGVLYLTLTGGEPLLRADFAEIYAHAHERGLLITVYTNATLITDAVLELFVTRPPRMLEVTQYGFTAETYDRVVDAGDGQYARFRRGLDRLRKAGVRVSLKAMAMKANRDEIHDIRRWAEAEGLRFRFDTILSPRIDGGRKPLEQRLSPDEAVALEADDQKRQAEFSEFCHVFDNRLPADDHRYQCGAGANTFLIDPYGKMHVCELSRRPGWNVLERSLLEGWQKAVPQLLTLTRQHTDGCGSCLGAASCSSCAGMAELEGVSSDDGDLYHCGINDQRMSRAFGPAHPTPQGLVRLRRDAHREPATAR